MNALEVDVPSATLEDILLAFGPRIERIVFYDQSGVLQSDKRFFDRTAELTDRNTATDSGTLLSGMTALDALYICLSRSARGIGLDVGNLNAVVAALTVDYYDVARNWTSLSATDGTQTGGNTTLGEDGLVTWTVPNPARWVAQRLNDSAGPALGLPASMKAHGVWIRLTVNATLTSPTSINEISALANINVDTVTARSEGEARIRIQSNNRGRDPHRFRIDRSQYGSMELTSTSITSAANLSWMEEVGR